MKPKLLKSLLLIAVLTISTHASAHDFEVDGIFYNIVDTEELTVQVTYKGKSYRQWQYEYNDKVSTPKDVIYNGNTYSVTSIGDYAFLGCSNLTGISIPNSVVNIGVGAFYRCIGLTSVVIPSSVTNIGEGAFSECTDLANVKIAGVIKNIERMTFAYCTGLTNIAVPNSVTNIKDYAFYDCTGLTSITIPNSVTSIGEAAFIHCTGLTNIESQIVLQVLGILLLRVVPA